MDDIPPGHPLAARVRRLWPGELPPLVLVQIPADDDLSAPAIWVWTAGGDTPGCAAWVHPALGGHDDRWIGNALRGRWVQAQRREAFEHRLRRRYNVSSVMLTSGSSAYSDASGGLTVPLEFRDHDDKSLDEALAPALRSLASRDPALAGADLRAAKARVRRTASRYAQQLGMRRPAIAFPAGSRDVYYMGGRADTIAVGTLALAAVAGSPEEIDVLVAHETTHRATDIGWAWTLGKMHGATQSDVRRLMERFDFMEDALPHYSDGATAAFLAALSRRRELVAHLGAVRLTGDVDAVCRVYANASPHRRMLRRDGRAWRIDTHPRGEEAVRVLRALGPRVLEPGSTFPFGRLAGRTGFTLG